MSEQLDTNPEGPLEVGTGRGPMNECLFCERQCPRCLYVIPGNWEHIEQVQPPGSNVFVCTLKRLQRPLVEILDAYLTHEQEHVKRTRAEWAAKEAKR